MSTKRVMLNWYQPMSSEIPFGELRPLLEVDGVDIEDQTAVDGWLQSRTNREVVSELAVEHWTERDADDFRLIDPPEMYGWL